MRTHAEQPLTSVKRLYLKENTSEIKNISVAEPLSLSITQKLSILACDDKCKRGELIKDFLSNVEFYHNNLKKVGKSILITFL